jgi:hypothetical protein
MLSDQTFNSDEERVLFEAKKIQQEGATLKLDKIITKIYFEYLRSSGEAKMILKDGEAKIVRKRGSSESGAEAEKVKLCIDNDVYFFEFKKNTYVEWDGHSLSELSVYNCGKRIFAVSVADSYDDIPDEDENKWMVSKDFSYYPQKINAFIKGEWVDKFMVLDKIIDAESKKSKADFDRDSLKQNAKIAKTNFGID